MQKKEKKERNVQELRGNTHDEEEETNKRKRKKEMAKTRRRSTEILSDIPIKLDKEKERDDEEKKEEPRDAAGDAR